MNWPVLLRRKPTTIKAMQWTGENFPALRSWCASVTMIGGEVWLWVQANGAQLKMEVGEWVAQDELGYYPIKDQMIGKNYDVVTELKRNE